MVAASSAYRQTNKITPVSKPTGLDPQELLRERENFISQQIKCRIGQLELLPFEKSQQQQQQLTMDKSMTELLRMKVNIELKALRLLDFQKQLRQEIVACMRADTTLETALNPKAYKRCKRQTLREARVTEKIERQQKQEAERKKRQKHAEYLNAIVEHSKNFKDFHRANVARVGKQAKAVINWHTNTERIQKKEQERLEKERLKLLMAEDEEGYRKLINEKKDMRLHFLLQQTDEYIDSITKLVKDHQDTMMKQKTAKPPPVKAKKRKSDVPEEEDEDDPRVKCVKVSTGEVLEGSQAPKSSELDTWLEAHPGWEAVPREIDEEEEDACPMNTSSGQQNGEEGASSDQQGDEATGRAVAKTDQNGEELLDKVRLVHKN
jgi:SWI/SNF-related matrix-associated actin-dependent regulator of chromatin subfamily A protein 2/4